MASINTFEWPMTEIPSVLVYLTIIKGATDFEKSETIKLFEKVFWYIFKIIKHLLHAPNMTFLLLRYYKTCKIYF